MIIYGSSLSPFVRKVLVVAAEKKLEVELRPTGVPQASQEFLEVSPVGKMPAMRDGDFHLADSSAIIHYLEALHPDPALIPAEPQDRGKTIWYEEYADTIIMAAGAKIFFNRVVAPRFLKRPGDAALADKAEREALPPILDYLEQVVPEGEGFLIGSRLTLADIAVAGPFATLQHADLHIDAERYPRLAAFIERIIARPSFAGWIAKERALMARVSA